MVPEAIPEPFQFMMVFNEKPRWSGSSVQYTRSSHPLAFVELTGFYTA